MSRFLLFLLLLCFICDLCIIGFSTDNSWRFATKPFLLPILTAYYICSVPKANFLFLTGLVMSFFGDLFLMLPDGFIPGLASFLIAHIIYILTFKPLFKHKNLFLIPLIITFVIGLFWFLYPNLGVMKLPVLLYAITIGTMLYVAIGTKKTWLIIGAVLFVISDSILALNLFYKHSTLGGLCVMFSYVIAQYCLVKGMIKEKCS